MKKLTNETNYKVAQEIGKLFDLKVVGVKAETLITQINEAIDKMAATQAPKAGKWYEVETPAFKEGDIVNVVSGWATGRQVQIVKPSAKRNAFKGKLFNPKTGETQDTLVGVDEIDIELYTPQYPAVIDQAI
ncbi:MAG: hypothetical protein K0R18_396 [Bacillales bacterium]|jgi:hypothetical protein|nr:hypothetical protein [Bacillales bacterium]